MLVNRKIEVPNKGASQGLILTLGVLMSLVPNVAHCNSDQSKELAEVTWVGRDAIQNIEKEAQKLQSLGIQYRIEQPENRIIFEVSECTEKN